TPFHGSGSTEPAQLLQPKFLQPAIQQCRSPLLESNETTRGEGGTEIAEVASGSAAELANLHVGLRDYIRGRQSSQQPDGTHGRPTASHARFAGSFGVYVP